MYLLKIYKTDHYDRKEETYQFSDLEKVRRKLREIQQDTNKKVIIKCRRKKNGPWKKCEIAI